MDDIHKSGIGLMDISPNNIMNCNGEFKFLDLGFAELYRYADMPIIVFGLEFYRSPWAHIASELDIEDNQELHLGRSKGLWYANVVCCLKRVLYKRI